MIIIAAALGLIIGSFLNVVICRMGTGTTLGGRSKCESCNTQLSWYELIPVFSFIAQKGKCRSCGSVVSWQYPLVEGATAALFAIAFYVSGPTLKFAIDCIAFSALVVIVVYDMRHMIIPSGPLLVFVAAALLSAYLGGATLSYTLISAMTLFFPFYILWRLSDGRWIGLGDADLAFGMGAMLGVVYGLSAVVLGFWIGALYALFLLGRRFFGATIRDEVPFAPFLIAGLIIVYATHVDAIGLSTLLYMY